MKKLISALTVSLLLGLSSAAVAKDVTLQFPIQNAFNDPLVKSQLDPGVMLFWGDQAYPKAKTVFGEFRTSQRTNALGKTKEYACQWTLASSIKELQALARRKGGNAVVNIKSNIKNQEKSSATEFDCQAGAVMVTVALKGTVVKLGE